VGGIHGNETAGILALQRVLASLWSREAHLSGEFIALRGNRRALAKGRRFVDWDLNRGWTEERVSAVRGSQTRRPAEADARGGEAQEQRELLEALEWTFAEARGEVYLLDLHSTSGPGAPFTTIADCSSSRDFAGSIPVPLILGLGEVLNGTLAAFVAGLGFPATVFEGSCFRRYGGRENGWKRPPGAFHGFSRCATGTRSDPMTSFGCCPGSRASSLSP